VGPWDLWHPTPQYVPRALPLLHTQPENEKKKKKTMIDCVEERQNRNPSHAQARVFRFSLSVIGTLEMCGSGYNNRLYMLIAQSTQMR
jgi:hypothetical protein